MAEREGGLAGHGGRRAQLATSTCVSWPTACQNINQAGRGRQEKKKMHVHENTSTPTSACMAGLQEQKGSREAQVHGRTTKTERREASCKERHQELACVGNQPEKSLYVGSILIRVQEEKSA